MSNGNGGIDFRIIFGLGAVGLFLWYVFTHGTVKSDASKIYDDLFKLVKENNPDMSEAEAAALAASLLAQSAVDDAHNAATDTGVPAQAQTAQTAEQQNTTAQTTASQNPTDTAAQQAAAAAAAAAATARAKLESDMQAQLDLTNAALSKAKTGLDMAIAAYNSASSALSAKQTEITQWYASWNSRCLALFQTADYGGKSVYIGVGDYAHMSDAGFSNDMLSSFQLSKGYKCVFYKDSNFGGNSDTFVGDPSYLKRTMHGTQVGNDNASSVKVMEYRSVWQLELNSLQDSVNAVMTQVQAAKSAVNDCIERVESVVENLRLYNVLTSRIGTTESSLNALRSYVASVKI